jgi:hypothetical protein
MFKLFYNRICIERDFGRLCVTHEDPQRSDPLRAKPVIPAQAVIPLDASGAKPSVRTIKKLDPGLHRDDDGEITSRAHCFVNIF